MASSAPADGRCFRFGVYEFDPAFAELRKGGTRISLQPQPAELLTLLLIRAGELVDRETIRQALWGDGTLVDFENGVNRCVHQLRTALLDDTETPRYIRTVPRRGYSFIGEVSLVATPETAPEIEAKAVPPLSSIAVLPFVNLSSSAEDEYFSDGLAEEIINVLAQVPGLKVIARTSAFAFKGRNEDVRTIAETLGVSNVVEGSVRRSGNRIRVTAQLINANDGSHLSSKHYDRELTDIFAVQDEISADVARQLRVQLGVPRHYAANLPAYEAYLEGRFRWHKYVPAEFEKGLKCFERAVAIDSGYAAAHTGIAQCCLGLVTEGGAPALEYLPRAAAAARRALELDDDDAEAHAAMGQISAMLDYDWAAAGQRFQRALDLNPAPYVRMAHAIWYLVPLGRATEAVAESDRVVAQDPLHLTGRQVHAATLMFARDYGKAAEVCLRVLDIDDTFPRAIQTLSYIRGHQRRFDESLSLAERLNRILGRSCVSLYTLALAHAVAGHVESARALLRELENLPGSAKGFPARIGLLYGLVGEPDAAFEWLERAIRQHDPAVLWMRLQPRFDCLRPDRRFAAMIGKLNLPG